jgi:hypothetical protein
MKKYGKIIIINVPVVYMARDGKMWAMSLTKAIGRGGLWNQDFFGPWNGNERSNVLLGGGAAVRSSPPIQLGGGPPLLVDRPPYPYRPFYGTIKKSTVIYKMHKIRLGYMKMFDVYFFSTARYTIHHGRMNYKDTKPYMSAFLSVDLLTEFAAFCLTDFIDWRYIYSWFVFLTP